MQPNESTQAFRDRRADPPPAPELLDKPAILKRSAQRLLCVICLAAVGYGTLGPVASTHEPYWAPNPDWRWIPPPGDSDQNDILTNFVVYIPVGFSLRLLLRRRGRAGSTDLALAMLASAAFSYFSELCQQFMPARSATLSDVLVNGLGAFCGGLIAPLAQRSLRQTHQGMYPSPRTRLWDFLAWATAAITAALMLYPPHPGHTRPELTIFRPLDIEDAKRYAMFVLTGFVFAAAEIHRSGNSVRSWWAALKVVLALAVLFELMQNVVTTHTCGLLDACVAGLGGLTGSLLAARCAELGLLGTGDQAIRGPAGDRRQLLIRCVALLAIGLCVAALIVSRLSKASADAGTGRLICWIPFATQFAQPFSRALAELGAMMALYGLASLVCLTVLRGRPAVPTLLVAGIAMLIEAGRALSGRGPADSTALVLALAAAWLAKRVYTAFEPATARVVRRASHPRSPPVTCGT